MAENSNSFNNNKELQKKATAASVAARKGKKRDPASVAKSNAGIRANKIIKTEVYAKIRDNLLEHATAKSGKPYYVEFIDKYLEIARKDPESDAGRTVAKFFFKEDMLDLLDNQLEKNIARDLDFLRYRAQKRLFKEQRDVVLDTHKRKKVVVCSRRAGKTDEASTNIVYTAITPNSPILYVNLTFSNAITQMFDLVVEQANEIGLAISSSSKNEGIILFENGSSVTFGGNANNAEADKYRGGKYRLVIIDEAGHQRNMKYLIEEVIQPMLLDYTDSQIILQGTPPRAPHSYVENLWNNDRGFAHYHWTMMDNPFIHDADVAIKDICEKKGLTIESPFIQREYFGIMGAYDTEAMVFKDRHTYDYVPNTLGNFNKVVIGVDFGFVDDNAVISLAYNTTTHQASVILEDMFNHATVTDIVNTIKKHYENARTLLARNGHPDELVEIFGDSSDKSILYELYSNYNLPAKTAWKYNKQLAIAQLAEELRTGRMAIPKKGVLDTEMDSILYKRDEATDAILPELDENLGIHPNAMFALLYASRQMFYDMGIVDENGTSIGGRTTNEF